MVIDSSAIVAILKGEPSARALAGKISADRVRLVSAANALESAMVIEDRFGLPGGRELDRLITDLQLDIVAIKPDHFHLARDAWRRFGKGRHPAALNFGDCLAYALSKSSGEPLLFTGDDFAKTDIAAA